MVCPLSKTETHKTVNCQTSVNYSVVGHVPFATKNVRQPQKKGLSPQSKKIEIKSVNCVSFVVQCVSAPSVPNVHNVVHAPLVGGCLQPFWQNWARLGANPRVVSILKEGYLLPFKLKPPLVRYPLIVGGYAHPQRNISLKEAIQTLLHKKTVEMVRVRASLAFFNRLFIVPKPNQKWRPILDLSALNKFLSVKTFKMEIPETIRISLQQGEWVTSLDFRDAYFHIPIHPGSRKVPFPKSILPVSGPPLWPINGSNGVHLCGQIGKVKGSVQMYKDPPVPRRLVDSSPYQRILPPGHSIPPRPLPGVGLGREPTKVRARTQTDFRVCGLQVRSLKDWSIRPRTVGESILQKLESILSKPSCRVRKFMSLIGLLTATEKLVPLGRLHMRPIQWHLKRHWRVPESLEKEILVPRSLHPHLLWWTKETNVFIGQPLHPLSHAIQIFTDASKEGWGAHLGDFTARGTWSVPESHLHINFLELKAVLLALKRFQHLVQGKVVLVATDNTTVVAYINKEGGMRSGSLCALLWRLLCWCTLRQVVLKARHIPGRLNVIADKLSRQGQVIQTEWSLHQAVFDLLVQTWHHPQVDMFATKYNCKLAQYVSPVPDPSAWAVDALTVSWENLDMYAFPLVSLLGKVISKLSDHLYKRVILIAPGWPNMPWFWDLVELSSQIPLCLPMHPDLVTQPFNKARHRNLTNLNLSLATGF